MTLEDENTIRLLAEVQQLREQIAALQKADEQRKRAEQALRQTNDRLHELIGSLRDVANMLEPEGSGASTSDTPLEAADSVEVAREVVTLERTEEELAPTQAQLDAEESAAIARVLLDAQTDEIAVLKLDGTIVFVNEAASRRAGKLADALVGSSIWATYRREEANHRKTVVKQVVKTGVPAKFIDRNQDEWSEVLIYPIRGRGDQVDQVAICNRDVSRQINAEERLKRMTLQLVTTQEDERRRISQDLHDDIGQNMTALILGLKAIDSAIAVGRQDVREQLKAAIRSAEMITKQIRQIFYQLRPPSLETMSLPKALESLCSSFAEQSGLYVDFSCQEDLPPFSHHQATALYRMLQEGLNNAVKHAKATSVWIGLDCEDGEVSASLEDNGQGFDSKAAMTGMGLQGIRDRFLMLNGTFEIDSAPGKGTRLNASFPLVQQSQPPAKTLKRGK